MLQHDAEEWIESYELLWRGEKGKWNSLGIFKGNNDSTSEVAHSTSLNARYIRLKPIFKDPSSCGGKLRIGVYGTVVNKPKKLARKSVSESVDHNLIEYKVYEIADEMKAKQVPKPRRAIRAMRQRNVKLQFDDENPLDAFLKAQEDATGDLEMDGWNWNSSLGQFVPPDLGYVESSDSFFENLFGRLHPSCDELLQCPSESGCSSVTMALEDEADDDWILVKKEGST